MIDNCRREINYLRISVTDLCNLRCLYCMPNGFYPKKQKEEILSLTEITDFVKVAVNYGINKIRLTGGEPLVRKGIIDLVSSIAKIDKNIDLCMTTNGILLDKFAKPLADAGLKRINISLDTVNPERYKMITQRGNLSSVFIGIECAKKAKLNPVKINCVIKNSTEEPDAIAVANYSKEIGCSVRFIKEMDLKTGIFSKVIGGEGGDCEKCNRLRLTADGNLKPCLFSELKYNIRDRGNVEALEMAIIHKPESGKYNRVESFHNIGG